MQTIDIEDFSKIDLRIGTILRVENFEKARKPPLKFHLKHFGERPTITRFNLVDIFQGSS